MKKMTILFSSIAMLFGVGLGVGAAVKGEAKVEKALAANSDWGYVGSGQGNGWKPGSRVIMEATGHSVLHSYKQFTFVKDEQFKFMNTGSWGSDIGFSNLTFGNAKGSFSDNGSGNIKCNTAGTYDVAVAWSDTDQQNYIGIFTSGSISSTVETQYIYIAEKPNDSGYWVPTTIYTFNGIKQYGNWSGKAFSDITGCSTTSTLNLNGVYGNVTKIPYIKADNTFLIHNGSGYQSADRELKSGHCYYYDGKGTYGADEGKVLLSSNADLGSASKFLMHVEDLRNAVEKDATHRIDKFSICGISKSNIAALVTEYEALNSTAKGYVDNSTVVTYLGEYGSKEGTVSYGDIVNELKDLNVRLNSSSNLLRNVDESISGNTATLVTVVVTIASCAAVGGFFFLRKKKLSK